MKKLITWAATKEGVLSMFLVVAGAVQGVFEVVPLNHIHEGAIIAGLGVVIGVLKVLTTLGAAKV